MCADLFRKSLIVFFAGLRAVSVAAPDPSTTPEGRFTLAVAELRRVAGPTLEKMESSPETRWFIEDLQKSPERMADLMFSGPLEDPAKSLRILGALWKEDPKGLKDRHEETTAAAVALIFAKAKWPEEQAPARYKFYRDSRLAGQLHPQFDTLETWEKCFVVSAGPNGGWAEPGGAWGDDSLAWLRDNVKLTAKEYTGACWQAPYKLNNLFGDSIHGQNYYAPFSDEIHAERVRDVGGVCGSLSHYGATAARANGLPAITMGEPGHCAYAVRLTRGDWEPAYSLSWQRSLHTSLWGNTWTQLILQEKVLGDREAYQKSMARVWQARAAAKRDPELAESYYAAALEAQPLNYPVWIESVDFMKDVRKPAPEAWEVMGKSICAALSAYPEAAWQVLSRIQEPALKAMPENRREDFFLRYHQAIASQDGPAMWDFDKALDTQVEAIGGGAARGLAFFEKVLAIQSSSKLWFAPTISWGQKRFGEGSGSAEFFAALGRVFSSASTEGNAEGIKAALGPAVIAAEKAGNIEAFQSLGKAGSSFRNVKPVEKAESFPGVLLSSGGLLQTSSTCGYDSPINHWGLLEEEGGKFHTDKQARPWAMVRLGKMGDVSGIVVSNVPGDGNAGRQLPLKVSVSEDGTTWHEVFRATEGKGPWKIPLSDKDSRVQYVKAERDDDRGEYFHLGGIRVYGRKLQ